MHTDNTRSVEATAFLDALQDSAPESVSACSGWTTHEVIAHLAGGAAEVSRHLRPYLAGDPVPATQSFEVREAPYRDMDDPVLRRRVGEEEAKMSVLIDQVLAGQADAVIPWTGREMSVAAFVPHMRSEFALHRWDTAGDDDTSWAMLGQPDLLVHAIGVLGRCCFGVAPKPKLTQSATSRSGCAARAKRTYASPSMPADQS